MLSPYRVLDLTGRGLLCAQILADLGADVIQVEPPEGSPARREGPFFRDRRDPEHSLHFWAYARNKRSVVLDLEADEGRDTLRRLAQTAHFFIESEAPGTLAASGLGYADLAALNPGLVYVSITPFGQDGPKAQWKGGDLVALAAGGPLFLYGDADRAPARLCVPQAWNHAAAEAAVAALVAHHERQHSGRGQHVDVSAQQAVTLATQTDILSAALGDTPLSRSAGGISVGPFTLRFVYPAKDGHISITHVFGSVIGHATGHLMEYVHEQGFCDRATRDKDWVEYGELIASGEEPVQEFERVKAAIAACTGSKTKAELFAVALERKLLIAPITTLDEVVESEQLATRGYFQSVDHEDLALQVRYPGPFARMSASPLRYRRRPPYLGEHTREVLEETTAQVAPLSETVSSELPLAGVKVLDFMWALAGPGATRIFADYGATVVRVESTQRMDAIRTQRPFQDGDPHPEKSGLMHSTNAGKLMLTLDPTTPLGREVALDLVRWADVVSESFTPKGMRGFGLDYAALAEVKPDIIMLSTCLMGQTGPLASFAGYGNLAAAITGFYELAGWPDRGPSGPFGAYTDYIAPRFNAAAMLAALEYKRRTGRGQHIDLSQAEAALHFLGPAILDYTVNGRVRTRTGNEDLDMAPHGVYACAGDDRWVAVTVADDAEWAALCRVLEQPDLASDARFATAAARLEHRAVLDGLLTSYTEKLEPEEAERRLQDAGVAASVVKSSREIIVDPQLLHRNHFVEIPNSAGKPTTVEGSRSRLSRTPAQVGGLAPTLGRDNEYVLKEILGYSDERVSELVIAGALE